MPQRKIAKKDLKQNKKRKLKNLIVKASIRTAIKNFKKAVVAADASLSEKALREMYKALDKAAKKNVIHKNAAARKKSRMSKLLTKKTSKESK
jgi:small subunit ribosomal protein S20